MRVSFRNMPAKRSLRNFGRAPDRSSLIDRQPSTRPSESQVSGHSRGTGHAIVIPSLRKSSREGPALNALTEPSPHWGLPDDKGCSTSRARVPGHKARNCRCGSSGRLLNGVWRWLVVKRRFKEVPQVVRSIRRYLLEEVGSNVLRWGR
jgi:hypothetical protein